MRLGRYGDGTAPRPVLIQFGSRLAENLTMETLYKIKQMKANFKKLRKPRLTLRGNGFIKSGANQDR